MLREEFPPDFGLTVAGLAKAAPANRPLFTRAGLILPCVNRGELPVFYCFSHLLIAALGAGAFSVDGWIKQWSETSEGGDGSA